MSFDPHPLPDDSCVVRSVQDGSIWIIALQGDFDALTESADTAARTTAEALRSFTGPLAFDLSGLTFCDSSLLNLFIRTAHQRPLALVAANDTIERLIDLTGLSGHLKTYPDLETARTALTSGNNHGPQHPGTS